MKNFLIEVLVSKKGKAYYESMHVMVQAKSVAAAKRQAGKFAEHKKPGWKAKPIDRGDGSVYRHIKFHVAKSAQWEILTPTGK
jgi:hypothetical protein